MSDDDSELRIDLWKLTERLLETDPESIFANLTQKMMIELSAANKRIMLAGGYHGRSAREIEIAEWIESEPFVVGDKTKLAITDLLDLVDCGRNRVEPLEEKVEALEDRERNLESQCRELEGLLENAQTYSRRMTGNYHEALAAIRNLIPDAKSLPSGVEKINAMMQKWQITVDLINERVSLVAHERDAARMRAANLEEAIKVHRRQKADDRCIEDDDRLYEALGDGIRCDRRVGSKYEMLRNCTRFIENRCLGGRWPTYVELEAEIARLKQELECLRRPSSPASPSETPEDKNRPFMFGM